MLSLEQQQIFERYKHPLYAGQIADPTYTAAGVNQSCGDEVKFFVKTAGETVLEIKHTSRACAICTASADLLAEAIQSQPLSKIQEIGRGDVLANLGIELSPVRVKCALLPLETLRTGLGLAPLPADSARD